MSTTVNFRHKRATVNDTHPATARAEQPAARVSAFFRYKSLVDLPLAMILLVPGLPVIGLLCLLIRATSPGPALYRQRRVGLNGRTFEMLKLRSMRHDAEASSGAVWCAERDPRITGLGIWLRKLHLDELPQLLNVLQGDMSLVGPRPERPEFVTVLGEQLDGYRQRLSVRPGITGLAQVNLPPDTDLASVARKLILDLQYIEQASLWLECRLLLCTATRVVKISSTRLLGLKRTVKLVDSTADTQEMQATPAALETARVSTAATETAVPWTDGEAKRSKARASRMPR